jgi:phosphate transport system protein
MSQNDEIVKSNYSSLFPLPSPIITKNFKKMPLSYQIKIGDSTHFQRSISKVAQDVLRMGALVEDSFRLSHQALFEQNLDAVSKVVTMDDEIDEYYRQIELDCANILTLQAPVAQDLRLVSAFMQLVRDLERIGDYAQDLGEIAIKLLIYPLHPCMSDIAVMSKNAQSMLAKSLVALTELDPTAGEKIKLLDNTVDEAYEQLYQTLAFQKNIKGVVEPIVLLILVIRHLERMADHATNIAQRVAYIVTGHRH